MENYQLIHGTYGLRREKSQAELEARQKAYPDLLRRHQERVTQALQRKQALEAALPQLTQQLADLVKPLRAAHYAQDVLFPKYRTFVLVCSLCELVQSGRCATLEGPQGAYQQLEAELQAGWILTDWNQILRQGTVCRPGSSSSALPCSRPPHPPCEALPGLTGGRISFKLPLYGGNTPRNRQIVAFP